MKALTIEQLNARATALEECAEHLRQNWSEDECELIQGEYLATRFYAEARRIGFRVSRMIQQSTINKES